MGRPLIAVQILLVISQVKGNHTRPIALRMRNLWGVRFRAGRSSSCLRFRRNRRTISLRCRPFVGLLNLVPPPSPPKNHKPVYQHRSHRVLGHHGPALLISGDPKKYDQDYSFKQNDHQKSITQLIQWTSLSPRFRLGNVQPVYASPVWEHSRAFGKT